MTTGAFSMIGVGAYTAPPPPPALSVSIRGAVSQTRVGSRTVITFFGPGSIVANQAFTADVLVVGGGGGACCGGGGGGGYQAFTAMTIGSGTTSATVGDGGAGAPARGGPASNGGNSTLGAITALGGGAGGQVNGNGANGGCGGGSGGNTGANPSGGTGSQGGNGGGTGGTGAADYQGGGGGGAGANGATPFAAVGGNGLSNSITGTATYYAGGGGGGSYASTTLSNAGGLGGGGGSHGNQLGDNGGNGLGGGGGASSSDGGSAVGGNGGAGIVIISYDSGSSAYLGPVATRTVTPSNFDNGKFQATSRTRHRAKVAITAIQVAVPGFFVNSFSESGTGADTTFYASVQQSSGSTVTRLPFGGSASGVVKDGTFALTDLTPINIAAGEHFWVKLFAQNAAGICYCPAPQDGANGEGFSTYVSGATDTTMTFGAAGLGVSISASFGPLAVLGMTTQPTVVLLGDSRQQSGGDNFDGSTTDIGECARPIGALLAYINLGIGGDGLGNFVNNSNALRKRLIDFCTGVQCEFGINDFYLYGASAASHEANIVRLRTLIGSKQLGYDTISPETDSGNTAPRDPTHEAARVQFNNDLRAGTVTGVSWFSEVADVTENSRNGGLWKAGYTGDGIHGNPTAMLAILAAGVINPALFTY